MAKSKFETATGTISLMARSGKAFTLEGDDKSWFSVYKAVQLQGAQVGDEVEFEFEAVTKGGAEFLNVQGNVTILGEGSEPAPARRAPPARRGAAPAARAPRTARSEASEAPSGGGDSREDKRQRMIVRQNSLTQANALLHSMAVAGLLGEGAPEELAAQLIELAKQFETFSMLED